MKLKSLVLAMGMVGLVSASGLANASDTANADKIANTVKTVATDKEKVAQVDPKVIEHGETLFGGTCVGCHGMKGEGGVGPKLSGKEVAYLKDKLHKYRNGEIESPTASMMAPMAAGLSDEDIEAVAQYIATLK